MVRPLVALATLATLAASPLARADEPSTSEPPAAPPEEPGLVRLFTTGFRWSITPAVIFPAGGGGAGFAVSLQAGYGIDTGPLIVTPGGTIGGYFEGGDRNTFVGVAMPTLRLTLPLGSFGPFVAGGAGVGHVTDPSATGLALHGGVGFMIYFSTRFGLGAELGYDTITSTDFHVWTLGPTILLGF